MSQNENSRLGSSALHTRLVKDVLIAIGGSGKAIVWRNETGMALNIRTEEKFTYGFKGSPDIIGFLENGKFVGFECKTGESSQSKEQKVFEAACNRMNAHYFVVHSPDEAREYLAQALGL